jgi:hypothetical protein
MVPLMILYVMGGEYLIVVGILMVYLFIAVTLQNIYLKGKAKISPRLQGP